MCIRDSSRILALDGGLDDIELLHQIVQEEEEFLERVLKGCLLYTSDAADERSSVDLGGRRIIKKKKRIIMWCQYDNETNKLY